MNIPKQNPCKSRWVPWPNPLSLPVTCPFQPVINLHLPFTRSEHLRPTTRDPHRYARRSQAALGAATSILDDPDGTPGVLAKRETQRRSARFDLRSRFLLSFSDWWCPNH